MRIHFFSKTGDSRVNFVSEATLSNSTYKFVDKSTENTNIEVTLNENGTILFKREGDTTMNLLINRNKSTVAHYSNKLGLSFNFLVKTTNLEITPEKITIEYDYYIDGTYENTTKIYLLVK